MQHDAVSLTGRGKLPKGAPEGVDVRGRTTPIWTRGGSGLDPLGLLSDRFRGHLWQPRDPCPSALHGSCPAGAAVASDRPAGTPIARCQAGAGTCHSTPGFQASAGLAALVAQPAGGQPRLAHPRRVHTRGRREPTSVRTSKAGRSARKPPSLSVRWLAPANRGSLRGPPNVLSQRARFALASIGTPFFACGLAGACDALAPKGNPRARSARVGSGTSGKRITAVRRRRVEPGRPVPSRALASALSGGREPAAGTDQRERSDRPRVRHDAGLQAWACIA